MPSLRSNKNLRALLPYPVTEERVCIGVSIPNDPQWIAAFYGQLYRLGLQSIWDRDEAHTAKAIAAVWMQVYRDTLEGSCLPDDQCDPCLERLLYDPATGRIGWNTDIGFYRVPDGPWTDPPLEPVWPPPQPYTTGTDPDRRCIASRNAALVLRQFYQETWGVFIDSTIGVVLQLSTTLFQATAALFSVAFGSNILLEAARALVDNIEAFTDPFPDTDVETVQCILYCNSSIDAEGVVTFDFDQVVSDFGAQGTDPFGGLNFLLQLYLHEDGLNAAGGIHNEDEADCSGCPCELVWCYEWDFTVSNGGWGVVSGAYVSGQGYRGPTTGAVDALEIESPAGAFSFLPTSIEFEFNEPWGGSNPRIVAGPNSSVTGWVLNTSNAVNPVIAAVDQGTTEAPYFRINLDRYAGNTQYFGTKRLTKVRLRGTGLNPYGSDNCL